MQNDHVIYSVEYIKQKYFWQKLSDKNKWKINYIKFKE